MASISSSGLIKIWNTVDFSFLNTIQLKNVATRIEFSPDDRYLVAFHYNNPTFITILKTKDYSVFLDTWKESFHIWKSAFS